MPQELQHDRVEGPIDRQIVHAAVMFQRTLPELARATVDFHLQMDGVRIVRVAPGLVRRAE